MLGIVGRTTQTLTDRIKQHVPLSIRKNTIGSRIQPIRACGKVPASIPTSCASAIGQHLIENANCAEHYNVDAFKILSRGRRVTHLRIREATFIYSTDPMLCRQKEFVHSLIGRGCVVKGERLCGYRGEVVWL